MSDPSCACGHPRSDHNDDGFDMDECLHGMGIPQTMPAPCPCRTFRFPTPKPTADDIAAVFSKVHEQNARRVGRNG